MPRVSPASALAGVLVGDDARRLPLSEAEFVALYARTAGPLAGYLRRLTGDPSVAEDLLQDAYIRFLSLGRVPDGDDHQKNYLYRIATNLARDHFRARQRRDRLTTAGDEPVSQPVEGAGDVWALFAHVSARDRELLLLAYVEGLTHQEIAQVTGLMRASVRLLLFRARKRFAAVLSAAGLAPASFGRDA
ncbi:MAG TPA: RNA polymerase sigma factor [Vicinamibacterales bacterium]|nr:RNA polymerase sigma factor [Vicinamibacterales bacterium]